MRGEMWVAVPTRGGGEWRSETRSQLLSAVDWRRKRGADSRGWRAEGVAQLLVVKRRLAESTDSVIGASHGVVWHVVLWLSGHSSNHEALADGVLLTSAKK